MPKRPNPGERVGVISHGEGDVMYLFGYGVFDGHQQPGPEIKFLGQPFEKGHTNPRITLDNGKQVWGCECWWGTEQEIKNICEGKTVVVLDIEEERRKGYAEAPKE